MPRQDLLLTPEHYDDWQTDRWYVMEVVEVTRSKRPRGIRASLQVVDEALEGKLAKCILPARLLPNNRTAKFLEAAGFDITGRATVDCRRAVKAVVEVRFGRAASDGDLRQHLQAHSAVRRDPVCQAIALTRLIRAAHRRLRIPRRRLSLTGRI